MHVDLFSQKLKAMMKEKQFSEPWSAYKSGLHNFSFKVNFGFQNTEKQIFIHFFSKRREIIFTLREGKWTKNRTNCYIAKNEEALLQKYVVIAIKRP